MPVTGITQSAVAGPGGPPSGGLVGWYAADDLALSNNDPVTAWADASGESHDADGQSAPPTFIANGLNGLPVVRFGGSQRLQVSTGTHDSTLSILAVAVKTGGGTLYQRLVSLGQVDVRGFFGSVDGEFTTFFGDGSWNDISVNTPEESVTAFKVLAVVNDGSIATPYVNGVAQNTKDGTMTSVTGFLIGDAPVNQRWVGDLAELLVYDHALSTVDRETAEAYLTAKWLP